MRSRSPVFAHAYNALLVLLGKDLSVGGLLPVQTVLAERCGVSRATISGVLKALQKSGVLVADGEGFRLARRPGKGDPLASSQSLSRRDEVERNILEMLISGSLRPGTTFSELALAQKFKVTTGTVREALLKLARLGIFTKPARKRWQFTKLGLAPFRELMDLRLLVEPYALKGYFRRPDRQAGPFVELLKRARELRRCHELSGGNAVRVDWELHCAILQGSGNSYLPEHFQFAIFATLIQWHHYNTVDKFPKVAAYGTDIHIKLLEAIVADKGPAALRFLTQHLQAARNDLLRIQSLTG
jgi:DNA-binding GntR family transcriptional regulator